MAGTVYSLKRRKPLTNTELTAKFMALGAHAPSPWVWEPELGPPDWVDTEASRARGYDLTVTGLVLVQRENACVVKTLFGGNDVKYSIPGKVVCVTDKMLQGQDSIRVVVEAAGKFELVDLGPTAATFVAGLQTDEGLNFAQVVFVPPVLKLVMFRRRDDFWEFGQDPLDPLGFERFEREREREIHIITYCIDTGAVVTREVVMGNTTDLNWTSWLPGDGVTLGDGSEAVDQGRVLRVRSFDLRTKTPVIWREEGVDPHKSCRSITCTSNVLAFYDRDITDWDRPGTFYVYSRIRMLRHEFLKGVVVMSLQM